MAEPPHRRGPPRPPAAQKAGAADRSPPFINLCGDYRFLRGGYWALVDAELNGVRSRPTFVQAMTAQNAAAALLVAEQAGIPTAPWRVAAKSEDVEPPCLLVPVAGLTDSCWEVRSERSAAGQWRRATQNGTRQVLAVRLAGPLRSMKMVVGVTTHPNYKLAWDVWTTFEIPLATIWYVEAGEPEWEGGARPLFVGLDPLPLHQLSPRELRLVEEVSIRPMSPS